MEGRKDDQGKPRYDLLPVDALDQVVRVLTAGAEHYGDENWRHVEHADVRYFSAAQRHLWAYRAAVLSGDHDTRFDHDSGRHHLAHAISCLLFMLELDTYPADRVVEINTYTPRAVGDSKFVPPGDE